VFSLMVGKPTFPNFAPIRDIHSGGLLRRATSKIHGRGDLTLERQQLSADRINNLDWHYLANIMWTSVLFNVRIRRSLSIAGAYRKMAAWLQFFGHIEWAKDSYTPPGSDGHPGVYEQYARDCLAEHANCPDTCAACAGAWRREREAWESAQAAAP
jgi:hypothetical protein